MATLTLAGSSAGPVRRSVPYLRVVYSLGSQRLLGRVFRTLVVVALLAALGAPLAAQGTARTAAISVGGSPLAVMSARGSLWVLTCDRRCSGEARRSVGRIVRVDPRRGRVVASTRLARPGALAVGARGVYATDFWRHAVRRLDPVTLRQTATLKLVLPFRISSSYAAFLPNDVTVGAGSVWVSTEWCALTRVDAHLSRPVGSVRLPCDAYQTMAFGAGALWISESLAGVYRIDPATNRVAARIQIGPRTRQLIPVRFFFARGSVLAVGVWTSGGALTGANGLARLDAAGDHVEAITPLPPGQLAAAFGKGALWVARVGGSSVGRIDPGTGRVTGRVRATVGTALAFADGRLWTLDRNGTLRPL
jgi:streptogramin lyase